MVMNEFEIRSYGGGRDWRSLRSGFDAGIGRETVVQMGGGNPELKTELQGNGWRKGDVDSPCR